MRIVHTIAETREIIAQAKSLGKSVGLVPTMGYFHEGHLSLMRKAREENDFVVASIFVNPIQFGPSEDLEKYPRNMARDSQLAEGAGVDFIFNPAVDEMYPKGYNTYVDVEKITEGLCGARRPGHFRGVATVVLKLFNIIQPNSAYFGQKDFQQLKVIERMVTDLNLQIRIVPMPIVREADGLAMSSRNTYLSADERQAALILSKSLRAAEEMIHEGHTAPEEITTTIREFIGSEPLARIEYIKVLDPDTLVTLPTNWKNALLALAVKIGNTRLIDNTILKR